MLSEYIARQMNRASYKLLADGTYFGEIKNIQGIWADGTTLEACRDELRDVLESWIVVSLRHGDTIPEFDRTPISKSREYA